MSATYLTAHGNARSSTLGAGPGMEPESSRILVRLVTAEPQRQLPGRTHFFPPIAQRTLQSLVICEPTRKKCCPAGFAPGKALSEHAALQNSRPYKMSAL